MYTHLQSSSDVLQTSKLSYTGIELCFVICCNLAQEYMGHELLGMVALGEQWATLLGIAATKAARTHDFDIQQMIGHHQQHIW